MSESFNYANGGKVQSFFTRLEDWLNSQNLSEIILVATSIILMVSHNNQKVAKNQIQKHKQEQIDRINRI